MNLKGWQSGEDRIYLLAGCRRDRVTAAPTRQSPGLYLEAMRPLSGCTGGLWITAFIYLCGFYDLPGYSVLVPR